MSDSTTIEWCDSTFNPWMGCAKISPACDHCYAERDAMRFGRVEWGAGKPRARTGSEYWRNPLRWNARPFYECVTCGLRTASIMRAQCIGPRRSHNWRSVRRRVFCASLADVFDNEVHEQWRVDLLDLIRRTPNLDWLNLTKRIGNVTGMLSAAADWIWEHRTSDNQLLQTRTWLLAWISGDPPRNVWLGATICNQAEANRDIPKLLVVPAARRFVSIEPMLGPVDLRWLITEPTGSFRTHCGKRQMELRNTGLLHWVIAGGESGPHARPMHPDWVRSLRDQCADAVVPFLFKQWGEFCEFDTGSRETHQVDADSEAADTIRSASTQPSWISLDGRHFTRQADIPDNVPARLIERVGKKKAGRLLDGVEHNGFPR